MRLRNEIFRNEVFDDGSENERIEEKKEEEYAGGAEKAAGVGG